MNWLCRLTSLCVIVILTLTGCKKSDQMAVDPLETELSNDYSWTFDTLKVSSNGFVSSAFAISSANIWAVIDEGFLHYDGTLWTMMPKITVNAPGAIYGMDSSDIWAASSGTGGTAEIIHYTNGIWNKFGTYKHHEKGFISGIFGINAISSRDIYLVGAKSLPGGRPDGLIMHYNGSDWAFLDVPKTGYVFSRICKDIKGSGKMFIYGYYIEWQAENHDFSISSTVYEFDGTSIKEIPNALDKCPFEINGRTYFTGLDSKLYVYFNGSFMAVRDYSNDQFNLGTISGSNENDFFILAGKKDSSSDPDVYLLHYNGITSSPVYKDRHLMSFSTFGREVFVYVKASDNRLIVAHGIPKY